MKNLTPFSFFKKNISYYQPEDAMNMIDHGFTIGQSESMHSLFQQIGNLSQNTEPVALKSEIGCGIRLLAHRIHDHSRQKLKSFIELKLNDSENNESLIELLELPQNKLDKIGTIFIYPIEKLPLNSQSTLYQYLKKYHNSSPPVRIIGGSSVDLEKNYRNYNFLKKLWEIFQKNLILVPSLRERQKDIPDLIEAILQAEQIQSEKKLDLNQILQKILTQYTWPQNNRELSFFIKKLLHLCQKPEIHPIDLHEILPRENPFNKAFQSDLTLPQAIQQFEKEYIFSFLKNADGNQSETAKKLGIHRKTLEYKMKKYNLKTIKKE